MVIQKPSRTYIKSSQTRVCARQRGDARQGLSIYCDATIMFYKAPYIIVSHGFVIYFTYMLIAFHVSVILFRKFLSRGVEVTLSYSRTTTSSATKIETSNELTVLCSKVSLFQ